MPTHYTDAIILGHTNDQIWAYGHDQASVLSAFQNNVRISITNGNDHFNDYPRQQLPFTEGSDGFLTSINGNDVLGTFVLEGAALNNDGSRVLGETIKVVVYRTDDNEYNHHYTMVVVPKDGQNFTAEELLKLKKLKQFEVHKSHLKDDNLPPVCFTAGTKISTPNGNINVEDLKIGDIVNTLSGPQEILWTGSRQFSAEALQQDDKKLPIRIKKGALGNDLPKQTVDFSRQHRIAITGNDGSTQLIAVAKLAGRVDGINTVNAAKNTGVEYVHIALKKHGIIMTAGIGAESLHLGGKNTAEFVLPAQRRELKAIFGSQFGNMAPAAVIIDTIKSLGDIADKQNKKLRRPLVNMTLASAFSASSKNRKHETKTVIHRQKGKTEHRPSI